MIALSPKTLLATNRFVCEICNKGFQRDQNLQLHRRGHNLPWKLRQRSGKEARKRVYVCPEPSCVHHDPSRALGDLTGIKKHFCRKHGEKRWACPRCGKRYAVQADLKAHAKTCGTREYRCDCGTLFTRCVIACLLLLPPLPQPDLGKASVFTCFIHRMACFAWFRRDSFVTHRAFCGALVEEAGRALAPPAPPSPRPPDLEAEENVDKDKEKGQEEEENDDSALAEAEQPQRVEAPVPEAPQRIPSPPPLPQEPPRRPSPPPLPKEPLRRPSPPPLPKEPQLFPSPLPFPLEQRPVVAVVPNVDGMLLLHLVRVLVLLPIHRLDEIYGKFLLFKWISWP